MSGNFLSLIVKKMWKEYSLCCIMLGMSEHRNKKFIKIHVDARKRCRRSQEFMALELGVSKRTIQNWEKGIGVMSFYQSLEWFNALYVNPFPLYMSVISPYNIEPSSKDEDITKGLHVVIDSLSPESQRALYFLFMGNHGSSAYSVIQLMLAHLHLPLKERIYNARSVLYKYMVEEREGNITCKDNIRPDTNNLMSAITKAEEARSLHEFGYNNIK